MHGYQAVSFSVLPDFRPVSIKADRREKSVRLNKGIDLDPTIEYVLTAEEQAAEAKAVEEKDSVTLEPKLNEYIFLIDRSYSMNGTTITLARKAL
jgi:hypothetical protein